EGLGDTARALADAVGGKSLASLVRLSRDLESAYDSRPATIGAVRQWLDRLEAAIKEVVAEVGAPGSDPRGPAPGESETTFWSDALVRQCRALQDELAYLAPWGTLPDATGIGD